MYMYRIYYKKIHDGTGIKASIASYQNEVIPTYVGS